MGKNIIFYINPLAGDPAPELIAVRVQDIEAQQWYNWGGAWDAEPQCGNGKAIYIAGWAVNKGSAGQCTIKLLSGSTALAESTLTLNPNEGIGFEWTGVMPATGNLLAQIVVSPGLEFWLTVTGYGGGDGTDPDGQIIAIRIQDIDRQLWFNYDNGEWDATPTCVVGPNKIYVAAWAVNQGTAGDITIQLINAANNSVLAESTLNVAPGDGVGFEWTGTMSTIGLLLICKTATDEVQFPVTVPGGSLYPLTIVAGANGTTAPVPGIYNVPAGQRYTVTARPDSDYHLDHWELDGKNVGTNVIISVTMNSAHTLKAVFAEGDAPANWWLLIAGIAGVSVVGGAIYLTKRKKKTG